MLFIHSAILLLGITFQINAVQSNECYNPDCDNGTDSLTNSLSVSMPQTCFKAVTGKRCFYTHIPECLTGETPLVYDIHGFYS